MPLDESDLKYLWDMLGAAKDAQEFIAGTREQDFLKDKMRRLAMERVIEIIGESARRVSETGRAQVPLASGAIVATRRILAHEYDEIDHEQLWRIATVHVPEMIRVITPILDQNPPGPDAAKDLGEP